MKGCFEEIKPGMKEMDYIGGELALKRILDAMEQLEPALAPCPFCGSPANLRGTFVYETPAVLVECSRCRCGTHVLVPGYNYLTEEYETFEQCMEKACARWNRRTEATA